MCTKTCKTPVFKKKMCILLRESVWQWCHEIQQRSSGQWQVIWKGKKESFSVESLYSEKRLGDNVIATNMSFIICVPIYNLIKLNMYNPYCVINFQIMSNKIFNFFS